ncbi:hypothetical protein P0G11_02475, partial [Adlercreutzia rubneri]|uniref:hypothetical protein n=1 Tax=Adlercreutzia rubneri TaxID=2916441 RepID=UPI0023AF4BB5
MNTAALLSSWPALVVSFSPIIIWGCGLQVGHPGVRKGVRMYDKRAKQDALDLWFSMPGEMSVDD